MTPSATPGGCQFCAIAAGRDAAPIVHQTRHLVAFLDTAPIRPGHLRVMPRDHFPHFNALPAALATELLTLGQRLADAQRAVFAVDRVGFLFPAGGVRHAHVDVVPLLSAGDVAGRRPIAGRQVPLQAPPGPAGRALAATAAALARGLAAPPDAREAVP